MSLPSSEKPRASSPPVGPGPYRFGGCCGTGARRMPEITAREMCAEMVAADLQSARRHALLKSHGLDLPVSLEG